MPRPRSDQPTPAELEILKVLWHHGSATVRQVMDHLPDDPPRAYTTVMSLLNVMHGKGLVEREPHGRAFLYKPAQKREKTLKSLVTDIVDRAFAGSASALVAHLLQNSRPSEQELDAIRKVIAEHKRRHPAPPREESGGAGVPPVVPPEAEMSESEFGPPARRRAGRPPHTR